MIHCIKCGKQYSENALSCPNCGEPNSQKAKSNNSSWIATFLFCFFLGIFGVHRFYVGKVFSGILMLLLTLSFFGSIISFIWFLVDLITIICKKFTDANGNYIVE